MGLGRGLVRRVFSKNRSSTDARDGNERHLGLDKSRWSSVRLYFCGDELNSVMVEDDSASVRSSEATVMQPFPETHIDEGCFQVAEVEEHDGELTTKQEEKFDLEQEAAIYLQSAFRGFMARKQYEKIRESGDGDGIGVEEPSESYEAASTEVLVGDFAEKFRLLDENVATEHPVLHKSRSQVYKAKEEWDDSTVSSDKSKLRIQNRLEATSRRERALVYAFSQQLRTCTTKKQHAQSDSTTEPNMGWSWLERWMATRVPENYSVEDCWSKHLEPITTNRKLLMSTSKFDVSMEGKESCGSNDVSVSFEAIALPSETPKDGYDCLKNKHKAVRIVTRTKTMPDYHWPAGSTRVSKRGSLRETKKKRYKQVPPRSTGETQSKVAPQAPADCHN